MITYRKICQAFNAINGSELAGAKQSGLTYYQVELMKQLPKYYLIAICRFGIQATGSSMTALKDWNVSITSSIRLGNTGSNSY